MGGLGAAAGIQVPNTMRLHTGPSPEPCLVGKTQNQTDLQPRVVIVGETQDTGDFREAFEELLPCPGSQQRLLKVGDSKQRADLAQILPAPGVGQRGELEAKEKEGKFETFRRG